MFEGKNNITLCDAAANSLFSTFLTQKFGVEIEVSSIEKDYHGLSMDFTEKNQNRH